VALRCLRIDYAEVQAALRRLMPAMERTATMAAATPVEEMRAFAPAIDIAQMWHEHAEVRLFAS
jgi:urease accessory protein UreF